MFKKLWLVLFLLNNVFACGQGSIIILNGTSSAGKSTLAKNLQKQLKKPYSIVSIDDFVYPELFKMAQKLNLVSVETMSNQEIHKIIAENVGFILASFDKSNQTVGWEFLKIDMYQQVADRVRSGENIILDTVLCSKEFKEISFFKKIMADFSICLVLVYCSPMILLEHVLQRNTNTDYIQRRDIVRVMRSFCSMYGLVMDDSHKIVDSITHKEIQDLVDKIGNSVSELGCDKQKAAQEIEHLLYEKFFQIKVNSADITCTCPYDICIDVGKLSLTDSILAIENYLK